LTSHLEPSCTLTHGSDDRLAASSINTIRSGHSDDFLLNSQSVDGGDGGKLVELIEFRWHGRPDSWTSAIWKRRRSCGYTRRLRAQSKQVAALFLFSSASLSFWCESGGLVRHRLEKINKHRRYAATGHALIIAGT
jgi:hypothetical protein